MKLLLLISIILLSAIANEYADYTFEKYVQEYKKTYPLQSSEYNLRKEIFDLRLKEIVAHNSNPSFSWKVGVNQFTDMTEAERKSYVGLNKKLLYSSYLKRANLNADNWNKPIDQDRIKALPTSVDWRTKGIITAVKNQGQCGSCWTFGATEDIESMWAQKTGSAPPVLSEQNILDCTPNPRHCGGTGGCEGGTVELAYDKIKQIGIASEKAYPYISGSTGRDYSCKTTVPKFANITGYVVLPTNQQEPTLEALANVGPLAINVEAMPWMGYRSGVFDGCNQKNPDIDHVVQLVGYGTDSTYGDYWLVRNSWGAGWGEQGYIRLKRESGTPRCGTDTNPQDGTGCDGGPPTVTVCGTCGVLFDNIYPVSK